MVEPLRHLLEHQAAGSAVVLYLAACMTAFAGGIACSLAGRARRATVFAWLGLVCLGCAVQVLALNELNECTLALWRAE